MRSLHKSCIVLLTGCRAVFGIDTPTVAPDAGNVATAPDGGGFPSGDGAPAASIAYMQGQCASSILSDSISAQLSAPRAGDLALAVVNWPLASGLAITTVTDSAGNNWLPIDVAFDNSLELMATYYAPNLRAAPGTTVVVSFGQTVPEAKLRLVEYRGLALSDVLEDTDAASGDSLALSGGTVHTSHAPDLIVGVATSNGVTTLPGDGYEQRLLCDGNAIVDKVAVTAGDYTTTAFQGDSGPWNMRVIALAGAY